MELLGFSFSLVALTQTWGETKALEPWLAQGEGGWEKILLLSPVQGDSGWNVLLRTKGPAGEWVNSGPSQPLLSPSLYFPLKVERRRGSLWSGSEPEHSSG